MSACSRRIFPEKVVESVKAQLAEDPPEEVPERMNLSASMKNAQLGDSTMVELEINTDDDQQLVKEVDVLRGREMLQRQSGQHGSICLVDDVKHFGLFGIVKETGIDDEGLSQFYKEYFTYPLYCDKSYSFYQALGDRKVKLSLVINPVSLIGMACDAYKRITQKGIHGNYKGEGIVQGGIIIFDASGKPVYAYEEETGSDLPVKDILAAIRAAKHQNEQQS